MTKNKEENPLPLLVVLLEQQGLTGWLSEYKFSPTRRWLFDLAQPTYKVAVEYEGGVFQSRSKRGAGVPGWHQGIERYISDARKYNEANILGWKLLRFTAADDLPYMVDCVKRAIGE